MKNLEDELGVLIFERGKGEVLVTPIGAEVVAQARRALEEADRVKAIAVQGRNPLEGPLRLGIIHTVAPYLLPELVAALLRSTPRMPLDIEENLTVNLDAMLRSGTIDAAIVALPFDAPGITVTALYSENFRVIVPAKHPWARRRTIRPDELAAQNLLLLNVGHCFRDQVLDDCHEFTRPPVQGKEGDSLETICNGHQMGISVLPATAPRVRDAGQGHRFRGTSAVASRSGEPRRFRARLTRSHHPETQLPVEPAVSRPVLSDSVWRGMKQRFGRVSRFARAHRSRTNNHRRIQNDKIPEDQHRRLGGHRRTVCGWLGAGAARQHDLLRHQRGLR